jgi:hypothetical protein
MLLLQKRRQLFIGTHYETLSVAVMCVDNPDRSPFAIHSCDAAPFSFCFTENVGDCFPVLDAPGIDFANGELLPNRMVPHLSSAAQPEAAGAAVARNVSAVSLSRSRLLRSKSLLNSINSLVRVNVRWCSHKQLRS